MKVRRRKINKRRRSDERKSHQQETQTNSIIESDKKSFLFNLHLHVRDQCHRTMGGILL